ncbi:MAG: glycosyltransferase [Candidatus Micrarchaeota archaeon]
MKVSIIIPTLNEEKRIERTLKSLKDQDYWDRFELIVADGNSTDNTVKIAMKYCNKVVTETTHTIAAGRQAGADAATGDILLFTDGDSIMDRSWVRKMSEAFENEKVAGAYGLIVPFEGGGIERMVLTYCAYFAASILNVIGIDYLAGSNMGVRKKAFDKIGGFNIHLTTGEDTDLMKRIRREGKTVFVPDAIVGYSLRRVRSWGYPKYVMFHTKNFFLSHITGKPAEKYDAVRE